MNSSTNPLFTDGIEKLCAICLMILRDADTNQSIYSTFEELESPMNVLQVLQSFSNFNFYNSAQMVCITCYGRTIEVYKFIQMCNKAHDNVQHYLKNIEAIKTIKDVERDVKIEEISISPTRIIIDGWKYVEEMQNEKISKLNKMEIKIEERILQGMEQEDSSDFVNLRAEEIDAQMHDERMDLIKCKDCHLVFSDKKELGDHRKEAKEKPSGTKYNFRSHDQKYNAKRTHISEELRLNQDRYQPLREQEIDMKCLECQEVFSNDRQLKVHLKRRHNKEFMCNDCGKVFTTKHNLNTHNRVHTGEKPFTCLICKRGFTAHSSFRSHMDVHNGVKAHKCEHCDRRFTRPSHLRNHMDIHNGVKAHKCEQCYRRFTHASSLQRHMKIHNRKLLSM